MNSDNNRATGPDINSNKKVGESSDNVERRCYLYDVIVYVESWLKSKHTDPLHHSHLHLPGFNVIMQIRPNNRRGGSINFSVHRKFTFYVITGIVSSDPSVEISGLHFINVSPCFNLFACYRALSFTLLRNQWHSVFRETYRDDCIYVGDFNAQNAAWNCHKTDRSGQGLKRSIDAYGLFEKITILTCMLMYALLLGLILILFYHRAILREKSMLMYVMRL